jgi:nucleoside phosphorylase
MMRSKEYLSNTNPLIISLGILKNMLKRKNEETDRESIDLVSHFPKKRTSHCDAEEDGLSTFSREIKTAISHYDYTVGWICALPLEMAAATAILDEIHPNLEKVTNDTNTYTLGRIGRHFIVIACLPSGVYGTTSATTVASQMKQSFQSIQFWLMVGIGGGVPTGHADIRLGDVVVSNPTGKFDGIIQYDFGKTVSEGVFERTGTLNKPPPMLLTAVAKLRSEHERIGSQMPAFLTEMLHRHPKMLVKYRYPGQEKDVLFQFEYDYQLGETCESCDKKRLVSRTSRDETKPQIHYGSIASGNQVMKHGITRDRIAHESNILCFEMEAAGLMDNFPCLVIRGISDYCDSHKNKMWQEYAAATAAAYSKELLFTIPAVRIQSMTSLSSFTSDIYVEPQRDFMDSLRFDQMDARRATIKAAHAETCKWLLNTSEYQGWLNINKLSEHHGFLWVKGKAGSGKSTIMKFALQEMRRTMPEGTITISFFFNARGGHQPWGYTDPSCSSF